MFIANVRLGPLMLETKLTLCRLLVDLGILQFNESRPSTHQHNLLCYVCRNEQGEGRRGGWPLLSSYNRQTSVGYFSVLFF